LRFLGRIMRARDNGREEFIYRTSDKMFMCLFAKRQNNCLHSRTCIADMDMDVTRACLLPEQTENKIRQHCPQAAIKLLALRDIRRS
jgi:hypothetical protein